MITFNIIHQHSFSRLFYFHYFPKICNIVWKTGQVYILIFQFDHNGKLYLLQSGHLIFESYTTICFQGNGSCLNLILSIGFTLLHRIFQVAARNTGYFALKTVKFLFFPEITIVLMLYNLGSNNKNCFGQVFHKKIIILFRKSVWESSSVSVRNSEHYISIRSTYLSINQGFVQ